jgi:DNA polymerase-3 subunit delta
MDSLTFLDRASRSKVQPVYALHGDEDFLKRQVLRALRTLIFGADADDFGLSAYAGDMAEFAAIHDELETVPFLSPRRLIVVENADPFVTRFRSALEKYVNQPSPHGVLVLEVKSWPATTRLAKMVSGDSTLVCKCPPAYKLPEWCVRWAASRHGKDLADAAGRLLVSLIGPDMGVLDQELTKLAIYVGDAKVIESVDVDQLVGSSRAENTFKIFDAIAAGRSGDALTLLDRLLEQGQEPLAILGAFSYQLRRLAQAGRLSQKGVPLARALDQVGIPPFARQNSEQQLRHLGADRVDKLYPWLLEADLGLKGFSQLPPRLLLERLVVRLASTAE